MVTWLKNVTKINRVSIGGLRMKKDLSHAIRRQFDELITIEIKAVF